MNGVIEPLVDAWTLGGSVSALVPSEWRETAAAEGDVLERRLLAIAAQAIDFVPHVTPSDITFHPPLPRPTMPVADDRVRHLIGEVRHSLGSVRRDVEVFLLLEAHGICPHPADISPSSTTEITPGTAPFLSWWASGPGAADLVAAAFLGTACARMLDPEAGTLFATPFLEEGSATVREAALRGLATGLGGRDRDLLLRMLNDASGQVRETANALLSATGGRDPEQAAQAASRMAIEVVSIGKKGILATLTGKAQRSEIRIPSEAGSFAALADARSLAALLDMAEEEIAPGLVFERSSRDAFADIMTMLAVTGSPATIRSVTTKAVAPNGNRAFVSRLMKVLQPSACLDLFRLALAVDPDLVSERAFPDAVTIGVLSSIGFDASDTVRDAVRSHSKALWTVAASCDAVAAEHLKNALQGQGLGPVGEAAAVHAILDLVLNLPRNTTP